MSYRETYENLCVCIEEYAGSDVETIAEQMLGMLGLMGEDLLDHLDPPTGLRRWLESHGLSLVATAEVAAPAVWDALEAEDEGEDDESPEHQPSEEPVLRVGDYVEYKTTPSGPRNETLMGAGSVVAIEDGLVVVHVVNQMRNIYLDPTTDVIRLARSSES